MILMRAFGNERMEELLDSLPGGIEMVEVGCFAGESALRFMSSGKVRKFHAVDPWKPWRDTGTQLLLRRQIDQAFMDEVEKEFDGRVARFGDAVVKMKMGSLEAAVRFELLSLDFVYIDADHSYESVKADLAAWRPRVKTGGILGGHDFGKVDQPGVARAVKEMFGSAVRVFPDSSWSIRVP